MEPRIFRSNPLHQRSERNRRQPLAAIHQHLRHPLYRAALQWDRSGQFAEYLRRRNLSHTCKLQHTRLGNRTAGHALRRHRTSNNALRRGLRRTEFQRYPALLQPSVQHTPRRHSVLRGNSVLKINKKIMTCYRSAIAGHYFFICISYTAPFRQPSAW